MCWAIPPDNPFGATNPVWAYGLRNPFGIAVSSSGQIAVTNNGPSGDAESPGTGYDTLILAVARGRGYQWPDCYGYSHPLATASCPAGQSPPDYSSERSTLVPTGAAFVDAAGPPPLAGQLVFCTFDAGMRIVTSAASGAAGSPHATVQPGPAGCRVDVKQGPDHAVYFSDTTTIYRVSSPPCEPGARPLPRPPPNRQRADRHVLHVRHDQLSNLICCTCHRITGRTSLRA
jgi:glucose/arabinose dehydrogenase